MTGAETGEQSPLFGCPQVAMQSRDEPNPRSRNGAPDHPRRSVHAASLLMRADARKREVTIRHWWRVHLQTLSGQASSSALLCPGHQLPPSFPHQRLRDDLPATNVRDVVNRRRRGGSGHSCSRFAGMPRKATRPLSGLKAIQGPKECSSSNQAIWYLTLPAEPRSGGLNIQPPGFTTGCTVLPDRPAACVRVGDSQAHRQSLSC